MSIIYTKNFFPFAIYDQTTLAAAEFYYPPNVSGLQLSALAKAYWLAKSYDYSIDVVWSGVSTSIPSYPISGTMRGAGTLALDSSLVPGSRTSPPEIMDYELPSGAFPGFSMTSDWTLNNNGVVTSGTDKIGSFLWFRDLSYTFYPARLAKDGSGNLASLAYVALNSDPEANFQLIEVGHYDSPLPSSPVAFTVAIDGIQSNAVPLVVASATSVTSIVSSGIFKINFNEFWIP
jgi:hypothetical protein